MSCNSTSCSFNDIERLQSNIITNCEPSWNSTTGKLERVLACNSSGCRANLHQWMDNCMCIPNYCGWKGADTFVKLPPNSIKRIEGKIQEIQDWCGDADVVHKRLKCPPVDSAAYLSDINYDCRFTGNPDSTIWAAQSVDDGKSEPQNGWRTSSFPPNMNKKPGLGPGCRWDNNCNQVCGHDVI